MAMEFRGEGGTKTVAIGKQVPRVENASKRCIVTTVKYQRGVLGQEHACYTSKVRGDQRMDIVSKRR